MSDIRVNRRRGSNGRATRLNPRQLTMVAMALGFLLALVAPMAMTQPEQASAQGWAAPRTVYFPETGHSLDQVFLDAWRELGGAETFGYPITAEVEREDGVTVQYLENARFEYWPDGNTDGSFFSMSKVGEELRPFTLQRSVASFTSTGNNDGGATTGANTEFLKSWMTVDAPEIENDNVRYVEATGHTVRYAFRTYWENSGGADFLGNPLTEEYVSNGVTYQVFERAQLAWENGKEARMMPIGRTLADKYRLDQKSTRQGDLPAYSEDLFVPPPTPTPDVPVPPPDGERWIEVNLSSQYMIAWQGNVAVMETYVSTGRPGFDTPPGTFFVNNKVPVQDMEGVLGGEYYNVPEVPDVMYFTNVGHAIHGTYWHNNFGAVMSHGCVNVPMGTSNWLYNWTPMGARVEIHW